MKNNGKPLEAGVTVLKVVKAILKSPRCIAGVQNHTVTARLNAFGFGKPEPMDKHLIGVRAPTPIDPAKRFLLTLFAPVPGSLDQREFRFERHHNSQTAPLDHGFITMGEKEMDGGLLEVVCQGQSDYYWTFICQRQLDTVTIQQKPTAGVAEHRPVSADGIITLGEPTGDLPPAAATATGGELLVGASITDTLSAAFGAAHQREGLSGNGGGDHGMQKLQPHDAIKLTQWLADAFCGELKVPMEDFIGGVRGEATRARNGVAYLAAEFNIRLVDLEKVPGMPTKGNAVTVTLRAKNLYSTGADFKRLVDKVRVTVPRNMLPLGYVLPPEASAQSETVLLGAPSGDQRQVNQPKTDPLSPVDQEQKTSGLPTVSALVLPQIIPRLTYTNDSHLPGFAGACQDVLIAILAGRRGATRAMLAEMLEIPEVDIDSIVSRMVFDLGSQPELKDLVQRVQAGLDLLLKK